MPVSAPAQPHVDPTVDEGTPTITSPVVKLAVVTDRDNGEDLALGSSRRSYRSRIGTVDSQSTPPHTQPIAATPRTKVHIHLTAIPPKLAEMLAKHSRFEAIRQIARKRRTVSTSLDTTGTAHADNPPMSDGADVFASLDDGLDARTDGDGLPPHRHIPKSPLLHQHPERRSTLL